MVGGGSEEGAKGGDDGGDGGSDGGSEAEGAGGPSVRDRFACGGAGDVAEVSAVGEEVEGAAGGESWRFAADCAEE